MVIGKIGGVSANVLNRVALVQESELESAIRQTMEERIALDQPLSLLRVTRKVVQVIHKTLNFYFSKRNINVLHLFFKFGQRILYFLEAAVDGMWTSWSRWSVCTRSCDGGKHFRSRTCTNPEPKDNGRYCVGPDKMDGFCNIARCPG